MLVLDLLPPPLVQEVVQHGDVLTEVFLNCALTNIQHRTAVHVPFAYTPMVFLEFPICLGILLSPGHTWGSVEPVQGKSCLHAR